MPTGQTVIHNFSFKKNRNLPSIPSLTHTDTRYLSNLNEIVLSEQKSLLDKTNGNLNGQNDIYGLPGQGEELSSAAAAPDIAAFCTRSYVKLILSSSLALTIYLSSFTII